MQSPQHARTPRAHGLAILHTRTTTICGAAWRKPLIFLTCHSRPFCEAISWIFSGFSGIHTARNPAPLCVPVAASDARVRGAHRAPPGASSRCEPVALRCENHEKSTQWGAALSKSKFSGFFGIVHAILLGFTRQPLPPVRASTPHISARWRPDSLRIGRVAPEKPLIFALFPCSQRF